MAYLPLTASQPALKRVVLSVWQFATKIVDQVGSREVDGQKILEAQARAEEARARVDRLLGQLPLR